MQLKNSTQRYGGISIAIHWLVAALVVGLFGVGLWMTSLSYYHPWYHKAPPLHMSAGVVLFLLMLVRVLWRVLSPPPAALSSHSRLIQRLSKLGHLSLYLLLFVVMIAGYLIFTAEGEAITLVGGVQIPALLSNLPNQADVAGFVHLYGAWLLIIFATGHGLAALKHHFIDKDATLKRMLGGVDRSL